MRPSGLHPARQHDTDAILHRLLFWLTVIFGSFCLFAETSRIVIAKVFVFAVSASSALFLIVDLSHPLEGLMQISDHHLRVVLPELDK